MKKFLAIIVMISSIPAFANETGNYNKIQYLSALTDSIKPDLVIPKFSDPEVQKFAEEYVALMKEDTANMGNDLTRSKNFIKKTTDFLEKTEKLMSKIKNLPEAEMNKFDEFMEKASNYFSGIPEKYISTELTISTPDTTVPKFADPEVQKYAEDYSAFCKESLTFQNSDEAKREELTKKALEMAERMLLITEKLADSPKESQKFATYLQNLDKYYVSTSPANTTNTPEEKPVEKKRSLGTGKSSSTKGSKTNN